MGQNPTTAYVAKQYLLVADMSGQSELTELITGF